MKKSFKVIVGTAIVALFCLITYVYFNVPGDEISVVSNITTSSNVVIRKSYHGTILGQYATFYLTSRVSL